jgi:signal recognition particle subunit SEC65
MSKRIDPLFVNTDMVVKELQRELETRQNLYPRWKNEGRIKADTATHRIACIKKAIEIVQASYPKQSKLF